MPLRRLPTVAVVLAMAAGCSTSGLAFVQDERVDVVTPKDRDDVTLPLTVRWTAEDLPAGSSFAVAVDTSPPRPGHAPDEDAQVVRTEQTEVTLDHLGASSRAGGRGLHRITVFLVDEDGRRVGESAWRVDVHLDEAA